VPTYFIVVADRQTLGQAVTEIVLRSNLYGKDHRQATDSRTCHAFQGTTWMDQSKSQVGMT